MYKQIMKKYIFLIILFTFSAFYGKSENDEIVIDSSDTIPCFKLSEVAQSVDTVSLKIKGMGGLKMYFYPKIISFSKVCHLSPNTHDPGNSSVYWIVKITQWILPEMLLKTNYMYLPGSKENMT